MADKTHYKEKYVAEIDRFIIITKDRTIKIVKTRNERTGVTTYDNKLKVKLPTLYSFAKHLGVSRMTLNNWAKKNDDFKEALGKIKDEQKQRLINMGLAGEYNSAIAKLMLSSNHGMVERTDETSKGEKVNTFNDEQIDRIADRINKRKGNDGRTSGEKKSN